METDPKFEKNIKGNTSETNSMAKCPVCGQRVTGERGGAIRYKGRLYHKSCYRKIKPRWYSLPKFR